MCSVSNAEVYFFRKFHVSFSSRCLGKTLTAEYFSTLMASPWCPQMRYKNPGIYEQKRVRVHMRVHLGVAIVRQKASWLACFANQVSVWAFMFTPGLNLSVKCIHGNGRGPWQRKTQNPLHFRLHFCQTTIWQTSFSWKSLYHALLVTCMWLKSCHSEIFGFWVKTGKWEMENKNRSGFECLFYMKIVSIFLLLGFKMDVDWMDDMQVEAYC